MEQLAKIWDFYRREGQSGIVGSDGPDRTERYLKIPKKDIDECATASPCFTGVECKNTAGSFYCKGNE